MAEHVMSALCERILTDLYSGKVSLIGLIERMTLYVADAGTVEKMVASSQEKGEKGILIPSDMLLVSTWIRSDSAQPEQARFRYTIINPAGVRIHEEPFGVDLLEVATMRVIIRLSEFPVTLLGRHSIVIEKEEAKTKKGSAQWIAVARLPLDLIESTAPPP